MERIYKYSSFEYKIVRRKRKTIGIKITTEGEVIITSPFSVSEETILNIVKKKEKWITDKIKLVNNHTFNEFRALMDGDKLSYLGKELSLEICYLNKNVGQVSETQNSNNTVVKVLDKKVIVYINNKYNKQDVIRESIIKFYKVEAERVLKQRTSYYSNTMTVNPNKITIKDQKTVWGSCSSRKNINYSYRLIMAPLDIIDYVVVHELCHLMHMNHSKEYWKTVEAILPDYIERKQWLKSYGHTLKI